MAVPTLEIKNVTKRFAMSVFFGTGTMAVKNLSLHVHPGEIYGLIGPNGSGKTTTIRMAAGLIRPSKGMVVVGGHDMLKAPTKAKRLVGYVPDNPDAYDFLTGREFLQFVGSLYGMRHEAIASRINILVDEYGIGKEVDGEFGSFSRGTKQKVAFVSALLHDPKLLLVDEPMVGLDPASAAVTERLLAEFAHRGGAVLLSTHALGVAERLCHRVGIMRKGAIVIEDRPSQLKERAAVRRGGLTQAYFRLLDEL